MKAFALISFVLFISCNTATEKQVFYAENKPSFFELRHGNWLTNTWIRQPENLIAIHETFKKVGYNNILGGLILNSPIIIQDLYINKNGYQLIDSLMITYTERGNAPKYYKEFWARRENEKNDSVVYVILRDIQYSYQHKLSSGELQIHADSTKWNDTLRHLLEMEYSYDSLTDELATKNFETLRRFGLHQSAYNLLYESYKYQDIKWNREMLEETLTQTDSFHYAWFEDDTK